MACWDILGKSAGLSVNTLLGGNFRYIINLHEHHLHIYLSIYISINIYIYLFSHEIFSILENYSVWATVIYFTFTLIIKVLKMSNSPQGIKMYRAIGQSRFLVFLCLNNCFSHLDLVIYLIPLILE